MNQNLVDLDLEVSSVARICDGRYYHLTVVKLFENDVRQRGVVPLVPSSAAILHGHLDRQRVGLGDDNAILASWRRRVLLAIAATREDTTHVCV